MALSAPYRPLTRLVLVRHGESRASVDRVVGGDTGCKGLTPHGVRQTEALRNRLAATGELAGTGALLASTLPRAIETAEILAPALGHLAVETRADLCELQPGEADGLSWEEFETRYGPPDIRADPYRPLSPGGESWAAFLFRVGGALSAVVSDFAGSTVVIACHGGIVEGSVRSLLSLAWPGTAGMLATPVNTSMTEWLHMPGGSPAWTLHRYNDHAHLDAAGDPGGGW
jgi:probable phosphoglycerate mutase